MTTQCDNLPGMMAHAGWTTARVIEQQQLAADTYRLRLHCPEAARTIMPGQFFMVRPEGGTDPLLGRPFALYDTADGDDGPEAIDFVYHVIGKMTGLMSEWNGGEAVEFWGPLGNGYPVPQCRHLMYIGGGIGYTPVLAVAREALGHRSYGQPARSRERKAERVTLCYGVRSSDHCADLSDLEGVEGLTILLATDDGSAGHHGLVTDLLDESLASDDAPDAVYCCGPLPMMYAVGRICEQAGVDCWLSLESPMACGFGACFSCVTRVRTDDPDGWDYRRTCVEGPVFRATELVLD
ncbi:MAG: dihydroorotate dehydrogenase electron transfer subunit [Planctomycetaceae bacterium]|nr:dihydroorotate dehydrogenase electron transfer subunit [Planctomycetaceae bacterium]